MDDSSSINVGRILGPHGLWGALRIEVYTDVPNRFDVGNTLYIGAYPYQVSECSTSNAGHVTLSFHEITTQSQARTLIDQWITVPTSEVPELPPGEFYHFQLLDLRVLTEEGEELGTVSDILETGSNDVYVVTGGSGEILIPALADVVMDIDIEQGVMVVSLPDGLR